MKFLQTLILDNLIVILIYLLIINLIAFITFGVDKYKAIHNKWRISEATLITLSAIGGGFGALLGMKLFHHKTKKPKFYVGIPFIVITGIILITLLFIL